MSSATVSGWEGAGSGGGGAVKEEYGEGVVVMAVVVMAPEDCVTGAEAVAMNQGAS